MRKYLLGAAAALAVVAPGMASADTGEITVSYGNVDYDFGDFDIYGVNGAYSDNLSGNWVVQFDGSSNRLEDSSSAGVGHATGSVGVRNGSWAAYGFLGLGDVAGLSTTNLGIGGQLFFSRATVNGSVGHADFDGFDVNVTDVVVDGTWFFTDNFGVTGTGGWAEADGSSSDADWRTLGLGGMWRPTGSNFTIGADYENIDADGTDIDSWRLSLTYNFGTGTELERSQSGASFGGSERLFRDTVIAIL